ncbi:MAG: response regulator [Gammaproteobacteria bacterium]|nr:response regulator [Gammaproteobacteria bacterium]
MKVLIVEDDPAIRRLHQRQLTRWGYGVDLAINGREAVERVRKSGEKGEMNYDLCLMDVNMPVMNGIDAIQVIRKNTTYLPIVAHSVNPDNKIPCLESGADEFLLKPRPAAELKRTLEECSVKQMMLYLDGESLSVRRVGPADREELTELRMLDKKGITKFTAVDISFRFLAHKNVQDKLLDDFGEDNFRFTEILDRTCQEHNVIQVHASQIWLKKISLTPEQFQKRVREEDALLKKYKKI